MNDRKRPIWGFVVASLWVGGGVSCHLQNQNEALLVGAEGKEQGLKEVQSAALNRVLDAAPGLQRKYCPSAQFFTEERVGSSLVTSCMTCHHSRRYSFNLDSALSDGDQFMALVTYLHENSGGVSRAAEHDLLQKAGGASHGGGLIWTQVDTRLGALASLVQAELTLPCDSDSLMRAVAAGESVEDAGTPSDSDSEVDEEF